MNKLVTDYQIQKSRHLLTTFVSVTDYFPQSQIPQFSFTGTPRTRGSRVDLATLSTIGYVLCTQLHLPERAKNLIIRF